jgi:cellulose synthase/poly-beta-1,6-N-acetylglucosamine synthase-like glycosyltransferase
MASLLFLRSLDGYSLILLFWFAVLLEIPRYIVGAVLLAVVLPLRRPAAPGDPGYSVSIVLVGHNEAGGLRQCVTALAEQNIAQTRGRMQIVVVDDGSVDGMDQLMRRLRDEGLIETALHVAQRGGKSAGVNLGLGFCRGDIVLICDIDTSLDRDAIAAILAPFADPCVGGVCGDLGVRNGGASLISRQQEIEYLLTISFGRRIEDMFGTLSIVSGAFGAFRRSAVEGVGGQDAAVGEDADLTMKLRRAGWRIRFAPDARALTDVPRTVSRLITQRLRWDRGLVTIWMRKFRGNFDPRMANFRLIDMLALLDVMLFQVVLTIAFPFYFGWLWYNFSVFAFTILGATLIGYLLFITLIFCIAAAFSRDPFTGPRLLPYVPLYMVTQMLVMRPVRLVALIQELIFRTSYTDPYVPARVMAQVERE